MRKKDFLDIQSSDRSLTEIEICKDMDSKDTEILNIDEDIAKLNVAKEILKELPISLREYDNSKSISRVSLTILFDNNLVNSVLLDNQKTSKNNHNDSDVVSKNICHKLNYKQPQDYPFFKENNKSYKKSRALIGKCISQRKKPTHRKISQ